jgi:DNA replication initiation complex subunit (GINS family)
MYNELYAAWKREVSESTLGALPADFYSKLNDYIKQLMAKKEAPEQKSVKVNLLAHEEQNVRVMVEELFNVRYKKIIDAITETQKIPTDVLTPEEVKISKAFFSFEDDYTKFAKSQMQGQDVPQREGAKVEAEVPIVVVAEPPKVAAPVEEVPKVVIVKPAPKRVTVRFSKPIPAIMGSDMKSYGPFVAEDVASLPELNAKILVKQGLAVLVEVA